MGKSVMSTWVFRFRILAHKFEIPNFKFQIPFLMLVLFFFLFSAFGGLDPASRAGDSSNPTTPVSAGPPKSPTRPVSSYSADTFLAAPYSPVSGNMTVTGNVGGGSYFRGYLPYTTQGNFMGRLESTSLDSFLRYSAPAGEPFYSPTASAPRTDIYQTAASDKIRTDNTGSQIPYLTVGSINSSLATPASGYGSSALYNQNQTGLLDRVSGYKTPEQLLYTQGDSQSAEWRTENALPQSTSFDKSIADILGQIDTKESDKKTQQQPTTSEQIKTQIDQFDQQLKSQTTKETADQKIEEAVAEQWKKKLQIIQGNTPSTPQQQKTKPPTDTKRLKTGSSAAAKPFPRIPQAEKMFEEKSAEYMLAALQLLKQGDFYQAADAFTWASLYRPSEPAGYVEKGIALFAAGEYMTASHLVAAGLNLSADYAKTTLDLADMLGGKEKLDSRISDLDNSAKTGNAGELYFLLAFIQYKAGQSEQAKASIDEAEIKMPNEQIVKALKTIINPPAAK
jgi:tetratricopeptide (TPR) repeat protein